MENWMCAFSCRWFRFLASLQEEWLPGANSFEKGYNLALILTLVILFLLLILLLILKLIFRRPAIDGITLARPDGDVVISRNAVVSLVLGLEEVFPDLELLKVRLSRLPKKAVKLTVLVNFRGGTTPFPVLAESLKSRVFNDLQQVFGIENVQAVEVRLQKKRNGNPPPATPAIPQDPSAFYGTGL